MVICDSSKTKLPRGQKQCIYCKVTLVVDHIPMYAEYHRHTSPKDVVVRTMAGYYSSEDILHAKKELIKQFGEFEILHKDMKKNRQNSNNRTDDTANCDDIVVVLGNLEDKGVMSVFVTNNWWKITKVQPDALNDLNVAEKVAEREAKFAMYETKICSILADMKKTSDRVAQVESENVTHNVQLGQLVDEAMRKKSSSQWFNALQRSTGRAQM